MTVTKNPQTTPKATTTNDLGAATQVPPMQLPPRIEVIGVSQDLDDGTRILHSISLDVEPGEVLAIAGGSGAGKTTLLDALAGLRPPSDGAVLFDGGSRNAQSHGLGYVPQDDIIHLDLPLRRTLTHAAALRLPQGATRDDIDQAADRALDQVGLCDRDDVVVADLSGGQRKRACIASELLTQPSAFFLDEPTSGLDPATGAGVLRQLRVLANAGATVLLTTHAPADLWLCDRVAFLAPGGHLAFVGTPGEALEHFGVDTLAPIYELLADQPDRWRLEPTAAASVAVEPIPANRAAQRPGWWRQFRALTTRNTELLVRNRLTMAILLGSPIGVVAMMAVLFRSGSFASDQASAIPAIQTLFWVTFASFFFGVTYGLLQIVGEFEIFRRERFGGLRIGSYVASKLAVLAPLLVFVNVAMLVVLRVLDRLPSASATDWLAALVTSILISLAAVALGLCASAAVQNPAQATLALPMLCFPQVLFAGAVVAVPDMSTAGQAMSLWLADRWGFEALGRTFDMDGLVAADPAAAGWTDSFSGGPLSGWLILLIITTAALAAATQVLHRRTAH